MYKLNCKESAFHKKNKSIGFKFQEDKIRKENKQMVERLLNV